MWRHKRWRHILTLFGHAVTCLSKLWPSGSADELYNNFHCIHKLHMIMQRALWDRQAIHWSISVYQVHTVSPCSSNYCPAISLRRATTIVFGEIWQYRRAVFYGGRSLAFVMYLCHQTRIFDGHTQQLRGNTRRMEKSPEWKDLKETFSLSK